MKGFLNRIHRDNGGFTLIELLVVIAILGVLAAVALPSFTGLSERGEEQAQLAEKITVQTAMDAMMAYERLTTVTVTDPTAEMDAFPTGHPLYPGYLRYDETSENYSCDDTGMVEQHLMP